MTRKMKRTQRRSKHRTQRRSKHRTQRRSKYRVKHSNTMRKNLKRRKTTRKYTRSRLIYKRRQRGGQPWARNWPDPRDSLKDKFGWRKAPVTSGNPKLLDWGPLEEERFIGLPGETSTTPAHNKHKKSKLSGIHQNDAARQTAHQMVLHLLSKENQAKGTEAFKHLPPTAQEIIRYGG